MTISKFTASRHYEAPEDQVPKDEEEQDHLPQAEPQTEQQYEKLWAPRQNVADPFID